MRLPYRVSSNTCLWFMFLSQLQEMEQELLSAPSAFRNSMSSKVRLYHRDLGKLQRHLHASDTGFGFPSRTVDSGYGIYATENERSVSTSGQTLSL